MGILVAGTAYGNLAAGDSFGAARCLLQSGMALSNVETQLVGGLVAIFYCPINIGNVIIPNDELIFFRGVGIQPPTR